jgi:1-acyl-sn-glycerol-3-phosphate acyltransferase
VNDLYHSALSAITAVGLTGVLSPVVSVLSLSDPKKGDPLIHFWSRTLLKSAGVKPTFRGIENLPSDGNFVLVLNHQSLFDIPMLFSYIPHHMRFVAKAQLFKIPLFGPALRRAGNVPVDRDGGSGDRDRMKSAATAVRERVSIVVFAEGTRSEDGVLRAFKKGAAALIPAAVAGTSRIMTKHVTWVVGGQQAALLIGEPIPTQGLQLSDRDALTSTAREKVAALLEEGNALVGV